MPTQAWFVEEETEVRPGGSVSLTLTIDNLSDHTQTYSLVPTGLAAPWTTVQRGTIALFAGSRDRVEVTVRPPAVHTTTAGPTTLALRVASTEDADDVVVAETTLRVQRFHDRRIVVLQAIQRARRRATFELMIENRGNDLASCRLHLVDPTRRVDGTFDPPAVGINPGGANLVRLKLHASGGFFRRHDRQLDFEIEATQPEHPTATARASMVQPPTIPAGLITRGLATLVGLGLLVAAWFAVVRPELREAADRAVDDRIAELVPTDPGGSVPAAPPTTAPSTDGGTATPPPDSGDGGNGGGTDTEAGEPFATRLAVAAGVGLSASQSYTVPAGSTLELTDIVVQNPNADLGRATLLRNGEVLYEWDLRTVGANDFQGRITPLPFAPGDELVHRLDCVGTGSTTATSCEVGLLLGGRLLAAD
jgi:hypothetical protein